MSQDVLFFQLVYSKKFRHLLEKLKVRPGSLYNCSIAIIGCYARIKLNLSRVDRWLPDVLNNRERFHGRISEEIKTYLRSVTCMFMIQQDLIIIYRTLIVALYRQTLSHSLPYKNIIRTDPNTRYLEELK